MKSEKQHIDWNLAGRILSGEASSKESEIFDLWLSEKENRNEWKKITKELEQVDYALVKEKLNIESAWKKVKHRTVSKGFINRKRYVYSAIAASILFIAGVFIFQTFYNNATYNQHIVQTQNDTNIVELHEGSEVTINKNSIFTYSDFFKGAQRLTTLQGEAFFSVSRNPDKPFVIQTNNIRITVLGTSFNVKSYPEYDYSEVIVKSGTVEVAPLNNPKNKVLLHPGDLAIYNNTSKKLTKSKNKNINYMAWKTKEIIFKNEKFTDAICLIEDVYNVKINIPTNFRYDDTRLTATFKKNNIDFIMKVINETYDIELTYKPK
jgi:ferric-dicitrate binding protein FerR (iron transport regulator)